MLISISPASYLLNVIGILLFVNVGQEEPITRLGAGDEQAMLPVLRVKGEIVRVLQDFHVGRKSTTIRHRNWITTRLEEPKT